MAEPKKNIYTVGGTVQAGGGIYIERKADRELLELCQQAEFAYVLSSRQVGKSSLMVRTVRQLQEEGIKSVIIDLSAIGVKVSPDEWYLGILNEIASALDLTTDVFAWWGQRSQLGQAQRLVNFCREVLLTEVTAQVVLFFDEIDSTLSIPFSDDFFGALRAIYNARSTTPGFQRLSFVLIGVATPSDLIADPKRTPFNIGQRVELTDFSPDEAMPLATGLGQNANEVLRWVLNWTGGHPYLTQRLCAFLSKNGGAQSEQQVAEAVVQLFEGEQGRQDNNLQFVRDMLTRRTPDLQLVLRIYKDIRAGKAVADDERSIAKSHLKISGVVRAQDGKLVVRNRIYERTFDPQWVRENTPSPVARRFIVASSAVSIIALIVAAFFAYQYLNRAPAQRAASYMDNFQNTTTPPEKLANLAGLIELGEPYAGQAQNLFFALSSEESKALFAPSPASSVGKNQAIVARTVYQKLNDVETDNTLLEAIEHSVEESDAKLASEIDLWLIGRSKLKAGDYGGAEANLSAAIALNPANPGLYFDRARANIGAGPDHYQAAFLDFSKVIQLDASRRLAVREVILANDSLNAYYLDHKNDYSEVAAAVTISAHRTIYDAQNGSSLPGAIARKEGDPPTGDAAVDDVYDYLGIVYEFFWLNYGRDSFDDKGAEIIATVHYQQNYDNAFWNSDQLVFGDGDVGLPEKDRLFNRFTTLDAVTREFTYGINQYEAQFNWYQQSGALSVSFGDVFASLVKQYHGHQTAAQANWLIGEDLITANVNGIGIRSLKAPGTAYDDKVLSKDPQVATMADYVDTSTDNGGVHINSGIPNHAFYLIATEIGGYAWEKAGRIWYITLRDKLKADSDFQDAANQTFIVAGELYGSGSAEQEAVRKGWAAVGITVNK